MENGKMFIYFTNISFTLITFHFVYGFNLSCITIKLKREEFELTSTDRQTSTARQTSQATTSKSKKILFKQALVKKSEENDTTVTEIVTSEDDDPSRMIRNLTCSPTIETKRDVYMFSSLPVFESTCEEDDQERKSSVGQFSGIWNDTFLSLIFTKV